MVLLVVMKVNIAGISNDNNDDFNNSNYNRNRKKYISLHNKTMHSRYSLKKSNIAHAYTNSIATWT